MSNYLTTDTELTSIANAIRTKGGTSGQLTYPSGFISAIENIPTGGGTYSETLLWTNPSLSSDFSGQSLNLDVSSYDFIKIIFTAISGAGSANYQTMMIKVSTLNQTYRPVIGAYSGELIATYRYFRYLYNTTNLYISDCLRTAGPGDQTVYMNSSVKPVEIYGVTI